MRRRPGGQGVDGLHQVLAATVRQVVGGRGDERRRVWKWCRCAPRETPARSATRAVVVLA